jgi:transketolase N-terminal domain/subunit
MTSLNNQNSTNVFLSNLRLDIIMMAAYLGHVGVVLSCVYMLVALYGGTLYCSPETVDTTNSGRMILSKGHNEEATDLW